MARSRGRWRTLSSASIAKPLFLAGLRGLGRSINTERTYASRVALFLSWCEDEGLDWHSAGMFDLARFLRCLVQEPLPTRSRTASPPRFRSSKTANAVMTAVCEFFRFAAREEWIDPTLVDRLSAPKYLRRLPHGFNPGEDGQLRHGRAKMMKFPAGEDPAELLRAEDTKVLMMLADRARDKFLIGLLGRVDVQPPVRPLKTFVAVQELVAEDLRLEQQRHVADLCLVRRRVEGGTASWPRAEPFSSRVDAWPRTSGVRVV
ncbi:site-specific integrase [Streptomyces sp. NPDC048496]|uniref:site-specific integrase n=1 Tax=Streptomyces sp. NPDC048496 TaxID=3365558 RepID=UPI00372348C3